MRRMIPQNKIEVLDKFNIDHIYDDAVVVDGSIYMSSRLGEGDPLISTNTGVLQISADANKVVGDSGNAAITLNGGEAPYVDIMANGETVAEFSYEEGGAGASLTVGEVHIDNVEATPQIYGDKGILQIGDINSTGSGAWVYFNNGEVEIGADNKIIISGLPNSDPHANGALWNDNGVLKISSGS